MIKLLKQEIGKSCPKCGIGKLTFRSGIYGDFLGCICYPACKYNVSETTLEKHKKLKKERNECEEKLRKKGLKLLGRPKQIRKMNVFQKKKKIPYKQKKKKLNF